MFYKLNVGSFLEFLCDLIPLSVGETNLVKLQTDYRYPNSIFFRRRPSYGIY